MKLESTQMRIVKLLLLSTGATCAIGTGLVFISFLKTGELNTLPVLSAVLLLLSLIYLVRNRVPTPILLISVASVCGVAGIASYATVGYASAAPYFFLLSAALLGISKNTKVSRYGLLLLILLFALVTIGVVTGSHVPVPADPFEHLTSPILWMSHFMAASVVAFLIHRSLKITILDVNENYETAQQILDSVPGIVVVEDHEHNIFAMSEEAGAFFGKKPVSGTPMRVEGLMSSSQSAAVTDRRAFIDAALGDRDGAIYQFPAKLYTIKDRPVWLALSIRQFKTKQGQRWRALIYNDVTDFTLAAETLKATINIDELTGAATRRAMDDFFRTAPDDIKLAVCLIDIDYFKTLNDTYGHDAGDDYLTAFGGLLADLCGPGDLAVRLGGEEFALIRRFHGWNEAREFGKLSLAAIADLAIEVNGRQIAVTASMGIAEVVSNQAFYEAMGFADTALREAKAEGRNQTVLATTRFMNKKIREGSFLTLQDVRAGLRKGELTYHIQPLYCAKTKEVLGHEALIRWWRDDGASLRPDYFMDLVIEAAREPEFRRIITAMRKDCLDAVAKFSAGVVHFNIGIEDIADSYAVTGLLADLQAAQATSALPVALEISERSFNERVAVDTVVEGLETLRKAGFAIALDDFGVKESNLLRLIELPVDQIKIDRAFITEIDSDERKQKLLHSIAQLAAGLEIEIVAEGVETEAEMRFLSGIGVTLQQGFLHGRPFDPATRNPASAKKLTA